MCSLILGTFRIKKKEIEQRREAADDAVANEFQEVVPFLGHYCVLLFFKLIVVQTTALYRFKIEKTFPPNS